MDAETGGEQAAAADVSHDTEAGAMSQDTLRRIEEDRPHALAAFIAWRGIERQWRRRGWCA